MDARSGLVARVRPRATCARPRGVVRCLRETGATGLGLHDDRLQADLAHGEDREHRARELVGRMAVALQAALLLESGHAALAEAFCATRLAGRGMVYGELPSGLDCATIIDRARPQPA